MYDSGRRTVRCIECAPEDAARDAAIDATLERGEERMFLNFGGFCSECLRKIPAGAEAIYQRRSKAVRHVECHVDGWITVRPSSFFDYHGGEAEFDAVADELIRPWYPDHDLFVHPDEWEYEWDEEHSEWRSTDPDAPPFEVVWEQFASLRTEEDGSSLLDLSHNTPVGFPQSWEGWHLTQEHWARVQVAQARAIGRGRLLLQAYRAELEAYEMRFVDKLIETAERIAPGRDFGFRVHWDFEMLPIRALGWLGDPDFSDFDETEPDATPWSLVDDPPQGIEAEIIAETARSTQVFSTGGQPELQPDGEVKADSSVTEAVRARWLHAATDSDEERDLEIVDLYLVQRRPMTVIAGQLGLPPSQVKRIVYERATEAERQSRSRQVGVGDRISEILACREEGMTLAEIALEFGVSRARIGQLIQKHRGPTG
jgi:hypothetical protein